MNLKRNIMTGAALIAVSMSNVIAMNMDAPNNAQDPAVVAAPAHLSEYPLNAIDQNGNTTLMQAIEKNQTGIAMDLIYRGADVNHRNSYTSAPLNIAIKKNNYKLVEFLLNKGADVDYVNRYACTALISATRKQDYALIEILANSSANANYENKFGCTALNIAVRKRDRKMAKLLMRMGANPFMLNKATPLTPDEAFHFPPIAEKMSALEMARQRDDQSMVNAMFEEIVLAFQPDFNF